MNLKHMKKIALLILTAQLSIKIQAVDQITLQQLQRRYPAGPQEICTQAGCATTEKCLQLHLSKISESQIKEDKQVLEHEFQSLSNYWLWPTDRDKLHAVQACLSLVAEYDSYIATNSSIARQGQAIIECHKQNPTNKKDLERFIITNNVATHTPFVDFRNKCRQDAVTIDEFAKKHSAQFPELHRQLSATRTSVENSLIAVYDKADHEEAEHRRAERLAEDQKHHRRMEQAQEQTNRIAAEKVRELQNNYKTLLNIDWHSIKYLDQTSLHNLERTLNHLREDRIQLERTNSSLQTNLQYWQNMIDQARSYHKLQEECHNLSKTNSNLRNENNTKERQINLIAAEYARMPKLTEQDRRNIDNNVIRLTQEKSELIQIRDQLSNERATFTQEATIRLKYTEQQNKVKGLEQSILQIKAEVNTLSSHGQIQPARVKDRLLQLHLKLQSLEQELEKSKQEIENLLKTNRVLQHDIVFMNQSNNIHKAL